MMSWLLKHSNPSYLFKHEQLQCIYYQQLEQELVLLFLIIHNLFDHRVKILTSMVSIYTVHGFWSVLVNCVAI